MKIALLYGILAAAAPWSGQDFDIPAKFSCTQSGAWACGKNVGDACVETLDKSVRAISFDLEENSYAMSGKSGRIASVEPNGDGKIVVYFGDGLKLIYGNNVKDKFSHSMLLGIPQRRFVMECTR